jgi:hypothetical protein
MQLKLCNVFKEQSFGTRNSDNNKKNFLLRLSLESEDIDRRRYVRFNTVLGILGRFALSI